MTSPAAPSRPRRLLAVLLTAVAISAVSVLPASAAAPAEEQDFVTRINQARANKGKPALAICAGVVDVARAWSDREAARNAGRNMQHNPDYAKQMPTGWTRAAENIAWGSGYYATVAHLHDALMNSDGHRANILGDFTHIGVGVTLVGSGSSAQMYVTQNFGKYPNGCGGSTTPPPSGSITLSVAKGTWDSRTKSKAVLKWSGASGSKVDVRRDGQVIKTTGNDGGWNDKFDVLLSPGTTYAYQVCQAGTGTCSPSTSVTF